MYIYHKFPKNPRDVSRDIGAYNCPLSLTHILYPATAMSRYVTYTTFPFSSMNYVQA